MALPSILRVKRPTEAQPLTEDQRKDLTFAQDFYSTAMTARRPYERDWFMNMAFFLGKQYLSWNSEKNQLEIPPAPKWRVRLVANKIMPTVLHMVAKMTKNRPIYVVIPPKADDSAISASDISRKVLLNVHRILQMDILNMRLFLWKCVYGTSFKDHFWDPTAGDRVKEGKTREVIDEEGNKTEEPILNEKGEQEEYDVNIGEVGCNVLSPFSVLPEPGATDTERSFRIMTLTPMSLEWIRQAYPDSGKYVKPETKTQVSSMEQQLLHLMSESFQSETIKEKEGELEQGFAVIKELREKPSQNYPKGRCIRFAGDVLLESRSLPYKFMIKRKTLGIVRYPFIELGERFWGRAAVDDMRPLQEERNKTASQIIENKNLMSKLKWIAHRLARISQTAITSEPGEVIEHSTPPGIPEPHPITPPQLPPYVFDVINLTDKDLDDCGLIARVSRGEAPPGVRSGVAISYLQEKDASVFNPFMLRYETLEGISGTYLLEIIHEKYQEPRLLKIVGENNEIETLLFKNSDDMPTDVWVQSGSSFFTSLAAKQNLILEYYQAGLLGNPQDERVRMQALRFAEIGGVDMLYEENVVNEREARRENRLFEQGEVPPVNVFDVHQTHIYFHDLFRKSNKYRALQKKDPQLVVGIDAHVASHMEADPMTRELAAQKQAIADKIKAETAALVAKAEAGKKKGDATEAKVANEMVDSVRRRQREDAGIEQPGGKV